MAKLNEREIMSAETIVKKGMSIRQAAGLMKVDESTLRYHLKRRRSRKKDGRKNQPEVCSSHADLIQAWINRQPWDGSGRPESIRMLYDELVAEHQFSHSYKSLVRYIRRRTPKPKLRPKRRVETKPGAQGQVDWLEDKLYIHDMGGYVKLSAYVLSLSFSRMWAVIWQVRQDMLSWLDSHNRSFLWLKGIPWFLRIDNLKTGVSQGSGPWAAINQSYLSYANQVGTCIDPCLVRKPEHKGKVERRIRDVKWIQIGRRERFLSLEDLQVTTQQRILENASRWICSVTGQSVLDSWKQEIPALRPLPQTLPTPFDTQVFRRPTLDSMVWFENRQYQVPFQYIDRVLSVRGCPRNVEIYSGNELLCRYPRGTDCRVLVDQSCYEGDSTETVSKPMPLGKVGRIITMEKSWEVPIRTISDYDSLIRRVG